MNTLRLTMPDGSVSQIEIATGSARNGRRVPAHFARAVASAPAGSALAVQTSRGWKPRRIVRKGRDWYTREV